MAMLAAVGNAVYKAHGGKCPEEEQTCVVCMESMDGRRRVVYLHCGHSFCLQPCFIQLFDHDLKNCPMCNTPLVVMSPNLSYLRAVPLFTFDPDLTQRRLDRLDRLRQFKLIHDGDTRESIMKLHGGVPDDILDQMRKACRICKFSSLKTKQSDILAPSIEPESVGSVEIQRPLQTIEKSTDAGIKGTTRPESVDVQPGSTRMHEDFVSVHVEPETDQKLPATIDDEIPLIEGSQRQRTPIFALGTHDHRSRFNECAQDRSTRFREAPCPPREFERLQISEEDREHTPMFMPGVQDHFTMSRESIGKPESSKPSFQPFR